MRRFLALGGVVVAMVVVAWISWGGGRIDVRRAGAPQTKPGSPSLRWSGGGAPDAEKRAARSVSGAVTGRVVDAIDGRAIAGATVTLRSESGEELDETSSDEDGAFSFEESGDAVLVAAAAPGYAIRAKDIEDGVRRATANPGEIVLQLDGAVTVSGVVVDPGGDPVAEAEVWIEDRERAFFRPPTVSSTVRTNAEGRFVVEDSPSGTLDAHAEHPDFASATLELGGLGPGRSKDAVRIELRDTGALSGRALDERGAGVPGAAMTWLPVDRERWRDPEITAVAETDGRYRFPHLPEGRGLVRARTSTGDGATETAIVLGAEASADVVVYDLPSFMGTVVDTGDRPVEGATVSIGWNWRSAERGDTLARAQRRRGETWETTTDAEGRFSLHAPGEETVTLTARLGAASGSETVEPGAGPVVLRLTALGIARVRVLGGDGKPYLGPAQVVVEGRKPNGGRWGRTQALENGFATFEAAPGEWKVRVVTREETGEEERDDDDAGTPPSLHEGEVKVQVAPAPPETDVTVRIAATLPARSTVRGRVVGSDGVSVVGARISVLAEARDWGGATGARLDWSGAVRSDASGRFAIDALPGTQKLFVYHPEFRSEIATVVVPAQGEGDAGVIRLEAGTGASAVYEFSGIGAVLSLDEQHRCVIQDVVAGGPAERAGVRAQDVVLEVDGAALHGMDLGDVIGRIRGPVGTAVTLRLERPGNLEPFLLDVVREKIRT